MLEVQSPGSGFWPKPDSHHWPMYSAMFLFLGCAPGPEVQAGPEEGQHREDTGEVRIQAQRQVSCQV